MKIFNYLISILLLFASCERIDGGGEATKFSPSKIELDNTNTSITIKSCNNIEWAFNYFDFDFSIYPPEERISIAESLLTYDYEEGKEQNMYNAIAVEYDWFRVEKIDNQTIKISLEKTTEDRSFSFCTFSGNPFQEISVTQKATP